MMALKPRPPLHQAKLSFGLVPNPLSMDLCHFSSASLLPMKLSNAIADLSQTYPPLGSVVPFQGKSSPLGSRATSFLALAFTKDPSGPSKISMGMPWTLKVCPSSFLRWYSPNGTAAQGMES